MNQHSIGVRMQVVGGDRVKAELVQIGRSGTQSLDGITKSSRATAFQMQNAALQVGDFFVQVSGGQSATRALAQQLPQLLGGFGLFGALAGAAFAALSPLIAKMFEGEDAAMGLADSVDELESATKAYESAAKESRVSVAELAATYGDLADEIKRARENKEALTRMEAQGALGTTIENVTDTFLGDSGLLRSNAALSSLDTGLDALIAKSDRLFEELSQGGATAGQLAEAAATDQAIAALQSVKDEVDDLAESYGITADEAVRVAMAANELRDAGSLEDQAASAQTLHDLLVEVFGSVDAVNAALPETLESLIAITEEAGGLASNMAASADEAIRMARNFAAAQQKIAAEGKVYSGRGGDPRTANSQGVGEFTYSGPTLDANNNPVVRGGRAGGGGGVDPRVREAERWFERTRTAAERYAEELADLNELQKLGYLDADTYARAVEEIGKSYGTASDQAKFFEGVQSDIKDGLLDAIVSGKDLADVFENLAKSIARAALEAALFNTGPFAAGGSTGGGLLGGLLGGIFGGFRAGGGDVETGKAYVVGERGPELFAPTVSGTIIPADRLGRADAGSVDVRVFVDEGGNWQAAVERISGRVSSATVVQNNRRLREAQRR